MVIAVVAAITLAVTGGSGAAGGAPSGLSLAPLSTLGALQPAPAPGSTGSEGVPVPAAAPLAGTAAAATGQPVDQISCQTSEQTLFHIHAHLAIFVNGKARQVPAAIGIPGAQAQQTPNGPFIATGTCFYWLHTHAADGIIHIESPVQRTYTLGDFFDEWGQPLGPTRAGPAAGRVVALYNGQRLPGQPARYSPDRARADPAGRRHPAHRPAASDLPRRAMTSSRHAMPGGGRVRRPRGKKPAGWWR